MLQRAIAERWFDPKAVIGFWPANAVGDDIRLYTGVARRGSARCCTRCASSFAPRRPSASGDGRFLSRRRASAADYVGAFVVTAGANEERIADRFARANDDFGSIMVKALADRIAESFAERMHMRVRSEPWAYALDENLTNEQVIAEEYRGIRPASAIPCSPITPKRRRLFDLLQAERRIGVKLTESYAMWPGSGW